MGLDLDGCCHMPANTSLNAISVLPTPNLGMSLENSQPFGAHITFSNTNPPHAEGRFNNHFNAFHLYI